MLFWAPIDKPPEAAMIVKYELDFKLVSNFLSSHVSMASISIVALNLDVYWAFNGCWLFKELISIISDLEFN